MGRAQPGLQDRRRTPARKTGAASPGWTAAPASACPSCRSWSAPPPGTAPARPRRWQAALPAPARRARSPPAGRSFTRSAARKPGIRIWADDSDGTRHDLTWEEDHAFWTWAIIEVLRATGIRVEELLELTHHSLIQYRLPSTGELVPLLQIAPSKTDTERLLVVSPDLADVLVRDHHPARQQPDGKIPLTARYDEPRARLAAPGPAAVPAPRRHRDSGTISSGTIRNMLNAALARTGLADAAGQPLIFTPHDFRRMFITDAILTGLPPHIAQVIAGHRDINVTLGYKAVYPDEVIKHHLAFLARRRALRPTDEYRTPTDEEWEQFLGHFERRKRIGRALRPGVRHPLHPRARLHPLPHALARPRPAAPHRRDPRQPHRPHQPKPNAKAGSARSKDSRSASPAPTTSSPRSTAAAAPPARRPRHPRDPGLPAAPRLRPDISPVSPSSY